MEECLFCKIIRKEIPAQFVFEDEQSVAVLDVNPRAPGHTMVLPRAHAENILELENASIGPVFKTVKRVMAALRRAFGPDGFSIGINHGRAAGQAIDHLHVHIIPRWNDDGGHSIHSLVTNIPRESLEEIRSKIINVFE